MRRASGVLSALSALSALKGSGVAVVMITGDAQVTAETIGAAVGLYDDRLHCSMSGAQVDAMTSGELEAALAGSGGEGGGSGGGSSRRLLGAGQQEVRVFYRTSPRHKLAIVQAFQKNGHVTAMTGDGINDAPALKLADIGIAMGKSGTDVSKEAADVVLVDDNFGTIQSAIEEGKAIYANIKNFLRFQLSTSVAALCIVAFCAVFGLPNPLNAMQILWINIIMDGPPAQSLGVEPVDPAIIMEPPRRRDDPVITRSLVGRVLQSAIITTLGTLFVFLNEFYYGDGVVTRRDTTLTFTTFVFFDMFNALACRSASKSIFRVGFTSNTTFLCAVGGVLSGQLLVVYFPPLQRVFQTEALSLSDLAYIIAVSCTVWIGDELRKWYFGSGGSGSRGGSGGGAGQWLAARIRAASGGRKRTIAARPFMEV